MPASVTPLEPTGFASATARRPVRPPLGDMSKANCRESEKMMVRDAVRSEPVSSLFSLLNRENTGILAQLRREMALLGTAYC